MFLNVIFCSLVVLPLLGFIATLFPRRSREGLISKITFLSVTLHFSVLLIYIGWRWFGGSNLNQPASISVFHIEAVHMSLNFYFDKITLVFAFIGSLLTFLIANYSRYYMHRESGFKRFFITLMLFYTGFNLTIFSGNFETLFIGWEILGVCSFVLIAFYRDRFLPVKNALKVFTVYRLGDVGLLLALWANHHLWGASISFSDLSNQAAINDHLHSHFWICFFISVCLLITAAGKSAQLPFSSWIPRAMEGPTPSSAIFYGSLSVHIGAFLLLRTFPFWEHQLLVRFLIGFLGLITSIVTSLMARVQATIKSQIAYSSVAQIGLIFIEIALGFENLALFHICGNAFLRTYQLLISPSAVSYFIREQFYNYTPRPLTIEDSWPNRVANSLYMLSLKEWYLDSFMAYFLWNPLKNTGRKLNFFTLKSLLLFFIPAYILGLVLLNFKAALPQVIVYYLPSLFAIIGLMMVLKSFSERRDAFMSWTLVAMNHFWVALAVSFNENFDRMQVYIYLSGVVVCALIGYVSLARIRSFENKFDLSRFHGHVYEHPVIASIFFIACLGITGFPVTPTFVGKELVFGHIHETQYVLAVVVSLSFIIDGLALVRIYARIFLGPHIKTYHETPYRSS